MAVVVLKRGQKDTAPNGPVTRFQLKLRALGLPAGPIDGVFGQKTEVAVRTFQMRRGIDVTGVVDSETLKDLQSVIEQLEEGNQVTGFVTDPSMVARLLQTGTGGTSLVPSAADSPAKSAKTGGALTLLAAPRVFKRPLFWGAAVVGVVAVGTYMAFRSGAIGTLGKMAFEDLQDATGLGIKLASKEEIQSMVAENDDDLDLLDDLTV